MTHETRFAPVPDLVQSKLNAARGLLKRIAAPYRGLALNDEGAVVADHQLATADALLQVIEAVELLAKEVRR